MPNRTEFLTVPEVMAQLRLGRTFVYAQARRYLATGGAEGIPCRRFGRLLRFPLNELEAYTTLTSEPTDAVPVNQSSPPPSRPTRSAHHPHHPEAAPADKTESPVQSELPFTR